MNKAIRIKVILSFIVTVMVLLIYPIILLVNATQRDIEAERHSESLELAYLEQNNSFCMVFNVYENISKMYMPAANIEKEELYVALHVYNLEHAGDAEFVELTINDIEKYLLCECNIDGEYYALNRPNEIENYVKWYNEMEGQTIVNAYWNKLSGICSNLIRQEQNDSILVPGKMNVEQLKELMNYADNPNYPIDVTFLVNY